MLGFTKAVTWFLGNEALNTIDHMLFAKMNIILMRFFLTMDFACVMHSIALLK